MNNNKTKLAHYKKNQLFENLGVDDDDKEDDEELDDYDDMLEYEQEKPNDFIEIQKKSQLPSYYEKIISYVYNAWEVGGQKAIDNCCSDDLRKLTSLVLHIATINQDQALWNWAIDRGIKPLHPVLREASSDKNKICEYHLLNLAEAEHLVFILKNTDSFIKEKIADKYNFLGYLLKTSQTDKAKIIIEHGWKEIGEHYNMANFLAIYNPAKIIYWLEAGYLSEDDFYKKNDFEIDTLDILIQKNEKNVLGELAEKINIFKKNGLLAYLINSYLNDNSAHVQILKKIFDIQSRNENFNKELIKILNFKDEWKQFLLLGNDYIKAQKKIIDSEFEWLSSYKEKAKLAETASAKKPGLFRKL